MGFKPILLFKDGERKATRKFSRQRSEARASALALFMGWTMPEGIDVEPTNDPVNYRH
jgi:hypothetical protein